MSLQHIFRHLGQRWAAAILVFPLLLTGCLFTGAGAPSQAHPSCSWLADPPSNADTVCTVAFGTLRAVARAEVQGDNASVHRLVPSAPVARRIIAYGETVRSEGVQFMHVVPNVTLQTFPGNGVTANFYLIGKTRQGRISRYESVYLQLRQSKAFVIHDQPGYEW